MHRCKIREVTIMSNPIIKHVKHFTLFNFTVEATENEGVILDNEENKNPDCRQVVFRFYHIKGYSAYAEESPIYSEENFESDYTKVQPVFKLLVTWQGIKTFEMYQQTFVDNDMLAQFITELGYTFKECEKWAYQLTHKFTMSI